ncbi:MAG: NAD(P)-binding protein [Lachnospiraceae bacterium]|nr:NAD(P)-binding protein [Lachnospiraceae bacterium]
MQREEAFAFTEKCYNGEPATCVAACPFHLDIKAFLKKASKGRISAAAKELSTALPFPVLISELCPAPCEENCQRMTVLGEETIAVNLLERSCLAGQEEKKERKSFTLEPLENKAAVVGAGPAGLACALHLSRKRFQVTVFEREASWGGSIASHERFADFEKEFIRKFEIKDPSDGLFEGYNIQFRFGEEITSLEQLAGFDMAFIATGTEGNEFGLLEGLDRELGVTKTPGIFLGGERAGLSKIEGLARALDYAKAMESWLQVGDSSYATITYEKTGCSRNVPHKDEPPLPHVVPAGELYTKDEAASEAARCMQCDCEECFKSCELLTKYKKKPPRIAIDVAQDGASRNSVSSACITRQTWSCNLCGHCAGVCEENVDIGGLFEFSRKDRVDSNLYPPAFHGYWLKEMEQTVSEASLILAPSEKEKSSLLFFPGCRLGGADPEYVLRSFEAIRMINGNSGIGLGCCGVPALWAGERERFDRHIDSIRQNWEDAGKPTVVYACASCRRTFERFLPQIPIRSLYEVLDEGIREGKITVPDTGSGNYAVFDPCAAYGTADLKESVRSLAKTSGICLSDYDSKGRCCGFGGHIQLANPEFYDEVASKRCGEAGEPFLVYCANCLDVFRTHGKDSVHILDLIFGLEPKKPAALEEKRENNLSVKKQILKKYMNEDFEPEQKAWDSIKLSIPEEVIREMERLLVPAGEVRETIWLNEEAQEGFENADGEILCRMAGRYITCWVRYKKEADVYHIKEVYTHRMHIREEE